MEAFFRNPFANYSAARTAPLHIDHAYIESIPSTLHGWLMALCLYVFVAFYAMGPGVCVWLALSELMPTRIRSNGMSIALVINQLVSTTLAAIFLPVVGKYGYSTMFFLFAGFTVIYFITVALFLPETKGKTLEEIEKHFERCEQLVAGQLRELIQLPSHWPLASSADRVHVLVIGFGGGQRGHVGKRRLLLGEVILDACCVLAAAKMG